MSVDLTAAEGGRIYLIVMAWILSGLVGLVIRLFLLRKYLIDRQVSIEQGFSKARIRVSERAIHSTWVHIVVKVLVMLVGIGVAISQWTQNTPVAPLATTQLALLLIPWLLTYDGIREYRHQSWLLSHAQPSHDAGRLFTRQDQRGMEQQRS